MAYVPPALRKKQEAAQAALPDASYVEPAVDTRHTPRRDLPDVHDIYDHFHPVDLAVQSAGATDAVNSTLHSSSVEPGKLKYVILFVDANPRWSPDKIIFAKSNLHLLPGAPRRDSATGDEEHKPGDAKAEDAAGNEQQQTPDQQCSDEDSNALQDYQMQLMLLEQQNKRRLLMARQEQDNITQRLGQGGDGQPGFPPAMSDLQMQLMLLEQQNKRNLLMARQEQENITQHLDQGPVGQPGFPPAMSPQESRAVPSTKPHEESTIEPNLGAIAVFEQVGSRNGGMRFIGYHKLTRIQFLEPRSAALVRMLEQKWSIPDKHGRVRQIRRDSDKWIKSLGYRWAVLKFEDDAEANATLDPPDVKINTERESVPKLKKERAPQKSVNELLRELRHGKEDQAQLDGEVDAASEDKKLC